MYFFSPTLSSVNSFFSCKLLPSPTPNVVLFQLSRLQDQLLTRFSFKPSYLATKEQSTSINCSSFISGPLWLPTLGTAQSPTTFLSLPVFFGCPRTAHPSTAFLSLPLFILLVAQQQLILGLMEKKNKE